MAGSCKERLEEFQQQLWPILALQFVLAVAGNGFAIYRFLARGCSSWHAGIIYTFNLAVSDLLYACSLLPLAIYYYSGSDWRYGLAFCKLDRFLFFCNLYGSTFFVTCISLNRYVAIVHPFFTHGRLEPHHAKLLSVAVWSLVAAIAAPVLGFSTTELKNDANSTNRTKCLGSASEGQLEAYWPYSLFLLAFGCVLPFLLTASSCGAILYMVLRNQNITTAEKRKVKVLVCAVVALYALSYLPFHVLRNLNLKARMQTGDCRVTPRIYRLYQLYQLAKILVHFHICIHPLLYAALADNLQEYCCRGFRRRKEVGGKSVPLRLCDRGPPGDPQNRS